ncbi:MULTISPECIES: PIG-L deacetylase family protein [unclassified Streptomyces]|uniref:PIG-L deacetylase family protein n=1 Tax=Streptomyces sp. NPDC048330 TaxID=3365533 RepID=UPI0037234A4E
MSETPDTPEGRPPSGAPLAGTHILVGERDEATAERLSRTLRTAGAASVHVVGSPAAFLRAGADPPPPVRLWDAAVWHAGLTEDHDELAQVLGRWRGQRPGVPVVVTDDAPSTRLAVAALRGRAADLVERPDADALVAALARALAERADQLGVEGTGQKSLRMLVVGAHPDDVEIGVGGTIHRRAHNGWDVTILTMSRGGGGGDPAQRRKEAHGAAEAMGARLLMEDLPDGSIADDRATVQAIERAVAEVGPDVVLVHSESDTHQDHRAVHRATLVACRKVTRLACYQSPSATVAYQPNRFVELSETDVEAKLAAIAAHHSQASRRWYLDEDLLRSTARYWGRFSQTLYAEPLELVHDSTPLGYFNADYA